MKCPYCGKELKDGIKFCSGCGNSVLDFTQSNQSSQSSDHEILCKKCGHKINNNTRFCKFCGWDQTKSYESAPTDINIAEPRTDPTKTTGVHVQPVHPKKFPIGSIITIVVLVIMIIMVAGGGAYYFTHKKVANTSSMVVVTQNNVGNADETTDASTDAGTDTTTESSAEMEESEMTMEYVDNSTCDVNRQWDREAFATVVSEDQSYYFSYPKYLFNHFSYSDEDGYRYWYEDGDGNVVCSMRVYKVAQAGDQVDIGKKLKNSLVAELTGGKFYAFPEKISKKEVNDDGFLRIKVAGWTDYDQTTERYTCASNDGQDSYYFQFDYPEENVDNDNSYWDYALNSTYRLLSFGGSSEPLKTYKEFIDHYK